MSTDNVTNTDQRPTQYIPPDSLGSRTCVGSSELDLLQVPADETVHVVLVGTDTPRNDGSAIFVHFKPLTASQVRRFSDWGPTADVMFDFGRYVNFNDLVRELRRRWPEAMVYDYGCLCCNPGPPTEFYVTD